MSDIIAALVVTEDDSKAHPPVVTLKIVDWPDAPPEGLKGVQIEIVECEYAADSAPDAAPTTPRECGKLTFDLVPNDAKVPDAPKDQTAAPPAWKGANPVFIEYWSGSSKKIIAAKDGGPDGPDFYLAIGSTTRKKKDATDPHDTETVRVVVPLRVPFADTKNFHDEADDYEIGMTISHSGDSKKNIPAATFSFQQKNQTSGSTIKYVAPARNMIGLSTYPYGARNAAANRPASIPADPDPIGRFTDPQRNPPGVSPAEARWNLDARIKEQLDKKGGNPVDVDGLLFSNFVPATTTRRKLIEDTIYKLVPLAAGKNTDNNVLKKTDIQKASFIIDDIGTDGFGPFYYDLYTSDPRAASESINGFVNLDGTYSVQSDLDDWYKGGTVYEWTAAGKWAQGYCMGFETVSDVHDNADDGYSVEYNRKNIAAHNRDLADYKKAVAKLKLKKGETPPDPPKPAWETAPTQNYVSIAKGKAYKKKTNSDDLDKSQAFDAWFKWTKETVDTIAALYVLASARANHLLTIATHCEVDRNLIWSSVFWSMKASTLQGYVDAEVKKLTAANDAAIAAYTAKHGEAPKGNLVNIRGGMWTRMIDGPDDVHADPSGLDVQVVYDRITEMLNDLGGPLNNLPKGVRYGVNRLRVVNVKSPGIPLTRGNGSTELHVFPHQSRDEILGGSWTKAKTKGLPDDKKK